MVDDPLSVLVGRQLSSVEFVMDYVQIRFGGPCLTAITHPEVVSGERRYRWGECAYRNMLCGCIEHDVRSAYIRSNQEAVIEFDGDVSISISLRPEDSRSRSGEMLIFDNGPEDTWIW